MIKCGDICKFRGFKHWRGKLCTGTPIYFSLFKYNDSVSLESFCQKCFNDMQPFKLDMAQYTTQITEDEYKIRMILI